MNTIEQRFRSGRRGCSDFTNLRVCERSQYKTVGLQLSEHVGTERCSDN